jgi:ATP-dependent DNA ligase
MQFTPMPLNRSSEPFSSPDWIYELKYDGFRALAEIEYGQCSQTVMFRGKTLRWSTLKRERLAARF